MAAEDAALMLREAVPGPHDYLFRKGFPKVDGLVLPNGELIVPKRHWETNALQGAQRVVVLEKSFSVGLGGVVSTDVRLALSGLRRSSQYSGLLLRQVS